jgi:hypothetical protein
MSYDERTAARIRALLAKRRDVVERRMFGGLTFMVNGAMCCGITSEALVVRVGPKAYDTVLGNRHVRPMTFTGRPLVGMVYVDPAGYRTQATLARWIQRGLDFVLAAPAARRRDSNRAMAASKKQERGAKRAMPKVSPLRGMDVDDWVKAKATGWQAVVVRRLLAIARKAAPDATVTIKWSQPVLDQGGPLAFIKLAKAHVTFGFWRGAELSDPDGVLEGGDRMKHVKILDEKALDEARITAFVREAVRLNRDKGDPTRR